MISGKRQKESNYFFILW